jgi:hypothetical protein
MAIRIVRNDAGNCINFFNSSNPTYWNACLEGQINEDNPNNVDVINKVRTIEQGTTVYEFYNLPYTDFVDKDENAFENASECAQYITDNANVLTNQGTFVFSQTDTLDAQREDTNTTVLFSNGDIYAVNSLQAIAASNGTITVRTIRGNKDVYQNIRYYNVTVQNGAVVMQSLSAAVDRLNEVLSGSAVGSDGGSADSGAATVINLGNWTVYGDRITNVGNVYTSTREIGNFDTSNGMYSNETISQAGEYFQWVQNGDFTSAGSGFTVGLFDETTYDVSDLNEDVAGNLVKNVLRLRVNNTPFVFSDPDSTYGKLLESGFGTDVQSATTFRMGLDSQNRAYLSYLDSNSVPVIIARTETALASNTELRLNVIMPLANELDGIGAFAVNTLDPAPSLTWYYIESPDGSFHYPLFTTSEQANYVDEAYGTASSGNGSSHQELFVDEQPSSQIWYMPDTYAFEDETSAPAPLSGVVWNEITTGPDADYVPSQYPDNTVTVDEGAAMNLQIKPAGDSSTYNVTGIPSGLAFNQFGYLVGNAPEVTDNNVNNPSDTYTITVTKANDYGSSVGTLTLVVNNLTQPATALSGFTWDNTSAPLVDSSTMDEGSVVTLDDTLQNGKRFVIDEAWVEANILPNLLADGDEVIIGAAALGSNWSTIEDADWDFYMSWRRNASNQIISNLYDGTNNELTINSLTDAYYDYGFEVNGTDVYIIACNVGDLNSEPSPADGGSFVRVETIASYFNTPVTLTMATISAEAGLSTSGISEIDTPVAPANSTDWNKALDFSGGSEYAYQVSNNQVVNPMQQQAAWTVNAPTTSGNTTADLGGRPWACAIVFRHDGNASNQHIWNYGEGAGSTDDNIFLRLDSTGNLYFGWGRSGALNECKLGNWGGISNTTHWHAVYIGYNGTRWSGANATATNLASTFDIRFMSTNDNTAWGNVYDVGSSTNWSNGQTGGRMDRSIINILTIGGRSGNRNFHGKVASMVVTSLPHNVAMPNDAEVEKMITDPKGWLTDYKVGNAYRLPSATSTTSNFQLNNGGSSYSTQVWLMGDGSQDSYANGIRNEVYPTDQNYTKLQLNSMQSNDIETVSITGLS